jgi:hypothetical protein
LDGISKGNELNNPNSFGRPEGIAMWVAVADPVLPADESNGFTVEPHHCTF